LPFSRLSPPPDFKYLGNYWSDCSLEIKDVQHTDEGAYYFSFKTTYDRWRSTTGLYLFVKELTALVQPSTATEGETVSLTCVSGCPTPEIIVWYKDGQPVLKPVFQTRREDAGRYYCAVLGQESVRSVSVALNVQYRPMNVAVSVDPQNVTEGSSVNLTCSCEANPAADNYTWYKRTDSPGSSSLLQVGSGQVLSLLSVDPSHAGVYLCQVMNSLGENKSTELLLTMEKKEPGL
uniref:Ig-like domain-containing protein n=1 Tax=Anabas testudineus TaxID=64144 RepID=A0A7N6BBC7_ANATE